MKNVTLRIDEKLLKLCRFAAVEQDKSLSQWLTELITVTLKNKSSFAYSQKKALKHLEKGLELKGKLLPRDELHARN
jgi:hypothetical protein